MQSVTHIRDTKLFETVETITMTSNMVIVGDVTR